MVSSLFAMRTIDRATEGQKEALRDVAAERNKLTVRLAAKNLENEISRYFELTQDESQNADFVRQLKATLNDPSLSKLRNELVSAKTSLGVEKEKAPIRERLLDSPERIKLDAILSKRLKRYRNASSAGSLRLATMFVTDRYGTIISIAYDPPVERSRNSAGRNYAYRTYFHGGQEDLDRSTPIDSIKSLSGTFAHMSAPFTSSATDLWKVAISLPIYFTEDHSRPDAVFVVTINLGDFQLLQSEQGSNQVVALLDARMGEQRGTVLQHPLLESRDASGRKLAPVGKLPSELMSQILMGNDNVDYKDPVADAPDGGSYAGPWIASMQPVALPLPPADDAKTTEAAEGDLLVLVQYRLSKVFSPIDQMRKTLLWEGAAALLSILIIALTLWFFVRRTSEGKTASSEPSSPSLAPGRLTPHDMTETMDA